MRWLVHQLPALILTAWGAGVFVLAGDKRRSAWMLGIVGQIAWVWYDIWLRQYGLLLGTFFYSWVYIRNWIKWGKSE